MTSGTQPFFIHTVSTPGRMTTMPHAVAEFWYRTSNILIVIVAFWYHTGTTSGAFVLLLDLCFMFFTLHCLCRTCLAYQPYVQVSIGIEQYLISDQPLDGLGFPH